MNTIGIIGAMEEEIIAIKRKMDIRKTTEKASMKFYVGTMNGANIVLVRCGIGKVNAAICAQILINIFDVSYIINTGVAGGLYPGIEIGDIIISSDTVEHDIDVTAFGHKKGYIPRMDTHFFEADKNLVDIAHDVAKNIIKDNKIYIARIASGDQFISSSKEKDDIYETFTAYCAEMEGAAIAHTCFLNKVPFVVIRAISDKADQSADINFDDFVDLAAKNASIIIQNMIERIKEINKK